MSDKEALEFMFAALTPYARAMMDSAYRRFMLKALAPVPLGDK